MNNVVTARLKVIAVDGPAGSGKTTVCAELAKRLGFAFISSGAIYRACAWVYQNFYREEGQDSFVEKIWSLPLNFDFSEGRFIVKYGEKVVSGELHTPEVASGASQLARIPEVREFANKIQRSLAEKAPLVVEGRDATTVVFPDACLKIFLTAEPKERARRRWQELVSRGIKVSFEEVLKDLLERDLADSGRALAPLSQDPDAVLVDSTGMTVDEVLSRIVQLYSDRCSSL